MRDLLPLFASGRLSAPEQASVESHLGTCADCRAELELLRSVARAFPAPAVDVASIARNVSARPANRAAVPFHRQPLWRVAASLTLFIVGTATVLVLQGRSPRAGDRAVAQAPQSGSASETTLAMAPSTGSAAGRSTSLLSLGTDLSELTDSQLESLLGSLDGLDPRPQADPMTIATPIIQDITQAPGRSNQ